MTWFWRQLLAANRAIGEFRSHFVGKVSPVHFIWVRLDLACTRFSGRPAPAQGAAGAGAVAAVVEPHHAVAIDDGNPLDGG